MVYLDFLTLSILIEKVTNNIFMCMKLIEILKEALIQLVLVLKFSLFYVSF